MADMTMILPYQRISPVHLPRRDLVLSSSDSIWLTVTVIESDSPNAQALEITGGLGGPAARLLVYAVSHGSSWWDYGLGARWDYGRIYSDMLNTLWSGDFAPAAGIGSFELLIPASTMAWWPPRCGWSVHLDWDGGNQSEMIADGNLHVRRVAQKLIQPGIPITTDGSVPILTDGP